jgi:hypothetical protein
MLEKQVLRRIQKYVHPFRITNGKGFRLRDFDPGDTRGLKMDKGKAAELLQGGTQWLAEEQDMLYAQDRWHCCSSSRPWTQPGKTAPSSTSCRG